MIRIAVLNGPNLNMLGDREPDVYGPGSYSDLCLQIQTHAEHLGCETDLYQTDSQGEMISIINGLRGGVHGLIINPGGYSHTSVSILDALRAFQGPVVEVHISQIHAREPFRHRMITAQAADALICGAGFKGYLSAMEIILELLRRNG